MELDKFFERYDIFIFTLQVDRCSADDGVGEVADKAADPTTTATDPATVPTDPATAATDPTTAATDQPLPADDGKPSTFSKCKVELYKSLSTIGRGAGMFLKGFGQAALTVMGAFFGAINGLLSVSATTGDKLATGVNLVNNAASSIVLVRDVTGGAATVATGLATMNRQNSEFIIENRDKLFESLDKRLDNYRPDSEKFLIASTTAEGGADGKSTDTTAAAAASPTNEGPQETTAEAAPPTTTPVQS